MDWEVPLKLWALPALPDVDVGAVPPVLPKPLKVESLYGAAASAKCKTIWWSRRQTPGLFSWVAVIALLP